MTITASDFIRFCERTIDGTESAFCRLDDESVNERPDLPGANSPFVLVTHALGAFDWWVGHVVCGHPSDRDRAAEFTATGSVADLHGLVAASRRRLRDLAPEIETATRLHREPHLQNPLPGGWTVGAALIHAYEELAQHLGHLEITVDLVEIGGRA
ncbi:MAG: DinB family protein [Acidimicrobiia bacterium]|nr:DinB family protein [Acidimicrobiia bacterium]